MNSDDLEPDSIPIRDPISAILFYDRFVNSRVYKEATIDASILDSEMDYYVETPVGRERLKDMIRRITPENVPQHLAEKG